MTTCSPGDIVLVRFPFTDLQSNKRRPALVISPKEFSLRYGDIVFLALTSRTQPEHELRFDNWEDSGLPKVTWCKPIIATISSDFVDRRLGEIHEADLPKARHALTLAIESAFVETTQKTR